MTRVKVDAGFDPNDVSVGPGSVWYLRNGVWVLRNGVVPVDGMTIAQMNERAGFADGSRQWAYDLTAPEKTSWDAAAPPGFTGHQTMVGQASCQWQTTQIPFAMPGAGVIPACPVLPAPIFIPGTGTFTWALTFPDADPSSRAWVMAELLLKPGQSPSGHPGRLIWTGAASDGTVDLWDGMIAVFGDLVEVASSVAVTMRYGSTINGW